MTQDVDTNAIEEARKARKREYDRARYAANREKVRERARERSRARYAANPEKERERSRARRAANPEKARERSRARRAANPEKACEHTRACRARRIASDPVLYKREEMLRSAKRRSRLKNLAFDITIDDISGPITCPILGIELNWRSRVQANNSPSLDRIIPELGYVRGNVMVISSRANAIKSDATPDELRRVADFYVALATNANDIKDTTNDVEN